MADQEQNGKREIISRSAKLPQHGFEAIRPVTQALADLVAPSTKERIAEQLGVAAKGRFSGKLATAGYYGFLERTEDSRLRVTERGQAFLGGHPEAERQAKREGVMSTNFGPIIYKLRSYQPKQAVITAWMKDDFGVPAASAEKVAETLVSVSEEAELIDENGRFSASAIEDTHAALESSGGLPDDPVATPTPKPKAATSTQSTSEPAASRTAKRSNATASAQADRSGGQSGPFVQAPVQVVVNVDASRLSAEQITDLVRTLQTSTVIST